MLSLLFVGLALLVIGIVAYPLLKGGRTKEKAVAAPRSGSRRARFIAIASIAVILPLGAALTYVALGSPRMPGSSDSASEEASPAAQSTGALEKQLKGAPTAAGYKQLANMYFAAGQYNKAVAADHRAIDLGANDASTWSEFGESIVMAKHGQVTPQALAAFANAMSFDPKDARARFYVGMAEAQIGNLKQAVAIWRDLAADGRPSDKWFPMVRQHIVAFSKQGGFDPKSIPPATPSVASLRSAVAAMTGATKPDGAAGNDAAPGMPAGTLRQDAIARDLVESLERRKEASPKG